jgi:hypothetical protein
MVWWLVKAFFLLLIGLPENCSHQQPWWTTTTCHSWVPTTTWSGWGRLHGTAQSVESCEFFSVSCCPLIHVISCPENHSYSLRYALLKKKSPLDLKMSLSCFQWREKLKYRDCPYYSKARPWKTLEFHKGNSHILYNFQRKCSFPLPN